MPSKGIRRKEEEMKNSELSLCRLCGKHRSEELKDALLGRLFDREVRVPACQGCLTILHNVGVVFKEIEREEGEKHIQAQRNQAINQRGEVKE
jgi:hypothetical protein